MARGPAGGANAFCGARAAHTYCAHRRHRADPLLANKAQDGRSGSLAQVGSLRGVGWGRCRAVRLLLFAAARPSRLVTLNSAMAFM
jgi:hypothetical protein